MAPLGCMVSVTLTNAEVVLVDKPDEDSIFVLLMRVRPCYDELPDISWTGHSGVKLRKRVRVRRARNQRKRMKRQSIKDQLQDLWQESKESLRANFELKEGDV